MKTILENLNYKILLSSIALGIIGIFAVVSSSAHLIIMRDSSSISFLIRQVVFNIFGIIIMIIFSLIDYKKYSKHYIKIYLFSIVLLLLPFTPLGKNYNGTRRAIGLAGFTFMPSDLYKLGAILFYSRFIIDNMPYNHNFFKGLVLNGILIAVPSILILIQPDLSTAITISFVLFFMYMIYGINRKFIPAVIIILPLSAVLLYKYGEANNSYQIKRVLAFLDPEKYYKNESWQVLNGLFAVSRGGLTGVGFGKSVFKFGYLADEVNNDMIFAVIAEEVGFIGSVAIIFLIVYLVINLMKEAIITKDLYGKIVLTGIALLIFIQSFINIGVSLNLIPNTGITLPFISNGGTSLIIMYMIIGVSLNISKNNRKFKKIK